jgi:hypothetical protein
MATALSEFESEHEWTAWCDGDTTITLPAAQKLNKNKARRVLFQTTASRATPVADGQENTEPTETPVVTTPTTSLWGRISQMRKPSSAGEARSTAFNRMSRAKPVIEEQDTPPPSAPTNKGSFAGSFM